MGTASTDPAIASYAKAPARTNFAGGVPYAYRELGPKGGIPVIFFVSEDLHRRISGCELVIYPDSGHGGIFQFHDTFAPVAVEFLDR